MIIHPLRVGGLEIASTEGDCATLKEYFDGFYAQLFAQNVMGDTLKSSGNPKEVIILQTF
jgi:hypothetical protein